MAYGLSILNASGTSEIFGSSTPNAHFLAGGQIAVPAAIGGTPGETSAISAEGMTSTNTDEVGLAVNSTISGTNAVVGAVRGNGSFKITNTGGASITATYAAFKIP